MTSPRPGTILINLALPFLYSSFITFSPKSQVLQIPDCASSLGWALVEAAPCFTPRAPTWNTGHPRDGGGDEHIHIHMPLRL